MRQSVEYVLWRLVGTVVLTGVNAHVFKLIKTSFEHVINVKNFTFTKVVY